MENPQRPQRVEAGETSGLAIASLIIGIFSVLLALIPIIGFISWLLAPLAILLGAFGLSRPGRGLAIAGMAAGGLGLLICLAWVALFATGAQLAGEIERQAREDMQAYDAK